MKVTAIMQVRTGSTRFPNKVLKEILGKSMLEHTIERVKKAKLIDEIIIATTTERQDDIIEKWANDNGLKCYRGSTEDVLDRYYQAAKKFKVDPIVRLEPDDPLKDPTVVDKIIKFYLDNKDKLDYASNTIKSTFPEGQDVEIFSFAALERAWTEAKKSSEREHVTPYIWNHPDKFRLANVVHEGENLAHLRWTVDYPDDLEFVRQVYARLYKKGKIFSMQDILDLLKKHPELAKINEGHAHYEGYLKSVREDAPKGG